MGFGPVDKRYEALVRNPELAAAELFAFVGSDLQATTRVCLQDSQNRCDERTSAVFKDPSAAEYTRVEHPAVIWDVVLVGLAGTLLARCSP